jgi:hypothetical protein
MRPRWLWVVVTLVPILTATSAVRAQSCPRVPAGLHCTPLPEDLEARRAALQALDVEGRDDVSRGDYPGAARAFGCLVESDPTPEAAGNLAVVLREQGALGDSLLIARCAEQLAGPGPTRERARIRRAEIERRIGLPTGPPESTNVGLADSTGIDLQPAGSPLPLSRARHAWSTAGLVFGAAVLVGSGIVYVLARDRAHQFSEEQSVNGYTDRARGLRDDARALEVGSWLGAGVGCASALAGVLLRF